VLKVCVHSGTLAHMSEPVLTQKKPAVPGTIAVDADTHLVASDSNPECSAEPGDAERPRELGGPAGPDPTRYGDWERKGRCIDF
jgi:hypothetical protein